MIKNQQDAAKALLKRKFIAIKFYLRKKKNLRKPNLTPKRIRKRRTGKAHNQQEEVNNRDQRGNKSNKDWRKKKDP